MSQLSVDQVDKQSGSTLTLGGAGTTVQPHASATVSGFGSPAYASNASATDNTVNVDASDNLQFNSGYGSTVTAYGCRAWVNFNGTGTVAIRDSGNVSSITDQGTGLYQVNFTTAMPDANYCPTSIGQQVSGVGNHGNLNIASVQGAPLASNLKIITTVANSPSDFIYANVAIFR